jgi:hypothetical protein
MLVGELRAGAVLFIINKMNDYAGDARPNVFIDNEDINRFASFMIAIPCLY